MNSVVSPSNCEVLKAYSTCAVANALEILKLRLRNEGFTNDTVRCLTADTYPFVARAVTLRIRCASPSVDGSEYLESTQWWDYILSVPAPRFLVIQDVDAQPGTGALVGEIHANIFKTLGCVGVATNGAVRDLPELQRLPFRVYARSLAVSHAYCHVVEMGNPVEIGGLRIHSSEWLHGDLHGILTLPEGQEQSIVRVASELMEREREILRLCREPHFSLDRLRTAIRASRTPPTL